MGKCMSCILNCSVVFKDYLDSMALSEYVPNIAVGVSFCCIVKNNFDDGSDIYRYIGYIGYHTQFSRGGWKKT